MTNREINKLNMFNALINIASKYANAIADVKALQNYFNNLKNVVKEIEAKNEEYLNSISGKTLSKHDDYEELLELLIPIKNSVYTYALDQKDSDLSGKFSITNSELKKLRDLEFIYWAKSAYTMIKQKGADLSDYGINDKFLEHLLKLITEFENSSKDKYDSYNSKKDLRETLKILFVEADETVEKIKNLMSFQKLSNPEFYNSFNTASIIKNIGSTRSQSTSEQIETTDTKENI